MLRRLDLIHFLTKRRIRTFLYALDKQSKTIGGTHAISDSWTAPYAPYKLVRRMRVFGREQSVINLHTEKMPFKHTYYMKAKGEGGKIKVFRLLTDKRWPRSEDELSELARKGSTNSGTPKWRVRGNGEWFENDEILNPSKLKNIELLIGPSHEGDQDFEKNLNDTVLCDMATGKGTPAVKGGGTAPGHGSGNGAF